MHLILTRLIADALLENYAERLALLCAMGNKFTAVTAAEAKEDSRNTAPVNRGSGDLLRRV